MSTTGLSGRIQCTCPFPLHPSGIDVFGYASRGSPDLNRSVLRHGLNKGGGEGERCEVSLRRIIEKKGKQNLPGLPILFKISSKNLVLKVLREIEGNKYQAAKKLGITRSTLYGKLRKHGIMVLSND